MGKVLKYVFGIVAIALGIINLIINKPIIFPFMFFFLSMEFLVVGIFEHKEKDREKVYHYFSFIICGIMLIISIFSYFHLK